MRYVLCISMFFCATLLFAYNPLHMGTRPNYPTEIKTIAQAAKYLLEPTGYGLLDMPAAFQNKAISQQQLHVGAKTEQAMTIEQALLRAIGEKSRLIVDHKHKKIAFETVH